MTLLLLERGGRLVRMRSTKRLPRSLSVPKLIFRRMTALRSARTLHFFSVPERVYVVYARTRSSQLQNDGERSMKKAPLAKITRPKLSGTFRRDRLFRLIDKGRSKPVVWVAAQAGSGKTTLVASYLDSRRVPCLWYQVDQGDGDVASFFYYMGIAAKSAGPRYKKRLPVLTPEYQLGVPVFTRRYFEELFRRLTPPFIIVLDDYQDAPLESGFHDILVHGLDAVPEGITVLVLSRSEPPAPLARLRANNRLQLIGWDDIRFTPEESGELLKAQGHGRATREMKEALHDKTEGWAAGLVLLMAGAGSAGPDTHSPDQASPASLFDYFASEIFNKAVPAEQDVLLRTSFLQRIEASDAERLTGNDTAGQILERLSRQHYFTEKYDQAYQYHPLFREFLQSRARNTFTQADVVGIQGCAAGLLEKSRRFEEAIGLFIECREWAGVERVVLGHAAELMSQGRHKTLEEWIIAVPVESRNSNPWLMYWLSICTLPLDPAKSRRLSEQAFMLFDSQQNETGAFLSWGAAIQSYFHEWDSFDKIDPLVAWIDKRMQSNASFPSPEIEALVATGMTGALLWRRRSYSEFKEWTDRALTLTQAAGDRNLRLQAGINAAQFYVLTGDFANGRLLGEELARAAQAPGVSPLMKLLCKSIDSFVQIMTMSSADPLKAVLESLEEAERSGIHMWDHMLFAQGACVSLNTGDMAAAGKFLANMKASLIGPKSFGLFHYHVLSGWYCLLSNEVDTAQAHAENALIYILDSKACHTEALFTVHFELAQILHEQAEYGKASDHMARAHELVQTSGSSILEYMHLLSVAQFAFDRGEQHEGLESLRRAMSLGRQKNYIGMIWWWRPAVMSRLCAKALEHGFETEYVRKLIRVRNLEPDGSVTASDAWPRPIRITTLGRFELRRDGKPVPLSGKKKQLEMLTALVSLGGTAIPEEQLTDLLWPDAEGDDAHNSFKMTLSRLRSLIGGDAVELRDGTLSLSRGLVYLDTWAFEQLYETAQGLWKQGVKSKDEIVEAVRATDKAFHLYQGPFLPAEARSAWTVSRRERLRDMLLGLTIKAGQYHEEKRKWKTAVELYQKGLEADPLQEEFYQRLMVCLHRLGQTGQAIAIYDRCRAELSASLGVQPSSKTESIVSSIRQ